jgi:DNA polymerase I-like protein with 3'-5' exonuclease and polymerase domains
MRVVCDIETESLTPSVIHCIVCKEIDNDGAIRKFVGDEVSNFREYASRVTEFIGHNFLSFDAPVLNRLAGCSITPKQVTDTLILSRIDKPDREKPEKMVTDEASLPVKERSGPHSLKAWGYRAGSSKIEFNDFQYYSQEMLDYCIQDVELSHKVYEHLTKRLINFSDQSIRMEHTIRALLDIQKQSGWAFKIDEANILVAKLEAEKIIVEKEVQETMLPMVEVIREVRPKYKKDGSMSVVGLNKLGDHMEYVDGPFTLIDFPPFNLGSRQQIGKQLIKKGWKPKKFTPTEQPIVDEEVLEHVNFPEAQLIYRYLMLQKRIGMVNNWISAYNFDTGCIHGYVNTLGANTNRMTHNSPNVAQTVAVRSEYGWECRSLWVARGPNRSILGCDASGLEARCLAHYINDAAFTKEILEGDIHTANQKAAGLDNRDDAKTFYYALIYGAGPKKIGSIVGGNAKRGKQLLETYFERTPALKRLIDNTKKAAATGMIRAMDGRLLNIRSEHSALNTLLQGMGAIVCKYWLIEIVNEASKLKLDYILVGSIHDEYQFDVLTEHAEEFGRVTERAMKRVETLLSSNCL